MRGSTDRPDAELGAIRARYLDFAAHEADGVSPLYAHLARGVAESEAMLRFIATLPDAKRQPNLVFAAVRHLFGAPADAGGLARLVERSPGPIRRVILARSTQTNEPGRCATLLPVLAALPQPLALLEVGASAGLCLLPDRYAYDYGSRRLPAASSGGPEPPTFPCRAGPGTPVPERAPQVAWRGGIDLNPVDLGDPGQAAWLQTLVWPGQEARAERLRQAIAIGRASPPAIVRGDLVRALPALAATAPRDATLVVFHSAVLAYVDAGSRARFAERVGEAGATWVSNESPSVLPWIAAKLARPAPESRFLLSVDGEPVAFTGPHGQSIDWIG